MLHSLTFLLGFPLKKIYISILYQKKSGEAVVVQRKKYEQKKFFIWRKKNGGVSSSGFALPFLVGFFKPTFLQILLNKTQILDNSIKCKISDINREREERREGGAFRFHCCCWVVFVFFLFSFAPSVSFLLIKHWIIFFSKLIEKGKWEGN